MLIGYAATGKGDGARRHDIAVHEPWHFLEASWWKVKIVGRIVE
jgi:hypothetical protein